MKEQTRKSYVGFIVGLLLGASTAAVLAYALFYVAHTVQKDARLVGLPIPVQTVPATVRILHEAIGASGVIQPSMPIVLTAKVISRVIKVPYDLGAVVKPGDLLVDLDPRLYEANLNSARVNYDHDHRQVERLEALMRKNTPRPRTWKRLVLRRQWHATPSYTPRSTWQTPGSRARSLA